MSLSNFSSFQLLNISINNVCIMTLCHLIFSNILYALKSFFQCTFWFSKFLTMNCSIIVRNKFVSLNFSYLWHHDFTIRFLKCCVHLISYFHEIYVLKIFFECNNHSTISKNWDNSFEDNFPRNILSRRIIVTQIYLIWIIIDCVLSVEKFEFHMRICQLKCLSFSFHRCVYRWI